MNEDKLEGMTFGRRMRDGRYPLYIIAANDFNDSHGSGAECMAQP